MPGLAEVLLGAVAGFTKLLAIVTNPSPWNFNGNLVTMLMGIEEAWRWGNLLAPALAKVATAFRQHVDRYRQCRDEAVHVQTETPVMLKRLLMTPGDAASTGFGSAKISSA